MCPKPHHSLTPSALDLSILTACQLNAAITYTQLARKLKISVTTARQGVLKLRQLGIIHRIVFIDYFALGYLHYQIYFQLRENAAISPEIWDALGTLPGLLWAGQLNGDFKLGVTICAPSLPEFEQRLEQLEECLRGLTRVRLLFPSTAFTYIQRRYQDQNATKTALRMLHIEATANRPLQLDQTDAKILGCFTEDPWLSEVELAKRIATPRQTIHQRLLKLEERGVLLGIIYGISAEGFGRRAYKLFLKLGARTSAIVKAITDYLLTWPETATIVRCLGPWDLEVVVEVTTESAIFQKQVEILKKFAAIVTEARVASVSDQTMSREILSKNCSKLS